MVPAEQSDVTMLALIQALRSATDEMKRLGHQQDRQASSIDEVSNVVHSIDKRLAIIEANSLTHRVEKVETDVSKLKEAEQRRQGAIGMIDWVGRNWPLLLAIIALIAIELTHRGVV